MSGAGSLPSLRQAIAVDQENGGAPGGSARVFEQGLERLAQRARAVDLAGRGEHALEHGGRRSGHHRRRRGR
jgi:hypothetical protein